METYCSISEATSNWYSARQRTLPQSKCYNPSGLGIENPSADNTISLEKLPVLNLNKYKKKIGIDVFG